MKTSDAIKSCERVIFGLLNFSLVVDPKRSSAKVFEQGKIDELRQIAHDHKANRRRKNLGVIGGSSMGIVGGGMGIAGVALAPFTFGASLGLLVAGATVGLAGSGVSIGFSAGKYYHDKERMELFKATCETYLEFVEDIFQSMTTIHAIKGIIGDLKTYQQMEISVQAQSVVRGIHRLSDEIHESERSDLRLKEKIKRVRGFADDLAEKTKMLVEHLGLHGIAKVNEKLNKAEQCSMESIEKAIPSDTGGKGLTYSKFARLLLGAHVNPEDSSSIPWTMAKVGRGTVKTGVVGVRGAAKFFDVVDDPFRLGASAAKVVKGLTTAGIILGAIGIAADLAFMAEAVYDLRQEEKREQERQVARSNRKEASEDEDFINKLFYLADTMKDINDLCVQ